MAVATSTQWSEFYRGTFPGFAASDVLARVAVTIGTQADNQITAIFGASPALVEPLGINRDDQEQSRSVTVFDEAGSVIRVTAGATVAQRQDIGVVVAGATNYAHPVTALSATQLFYGPVTGASGAIVYRLGTALEEANPGEQFALRVNVKQLSGLA